MFNKIKNYIKGESGMQMLEVALILVGTILVGGFIYVLYSAIGDKVNDATDQLNSMGGGGNTPTAP